MQKNPCLVLLRTCKNSASGIVSQTGASPPLNELELALWLKDPLGTLPVRHRRLRRRRVLLLLPPVLGAVHVDLLPPALIAAERRVPSSLQENARNGYGEINTITRT